MIDPRIPALCAEYAIEIVPKSRAPEPGQTRAPETMSRILRRHGESHFRMVLTTMRETANNHALLSETGLWSASDMILACPEVVEHQTSEWLAFWDVMPVGPLQAIAQQVAGKLPVRYILGGMLYERIAGRFGERFKQPDLLDDRRRTG